MHSIDELEDNSLIGSGEVIGVLGITGIAFRDPYKGRIGRLRRVVHRIIRRPIDSGPVFSTNRVNWSDDDNDRMNRAMRLVRRIGDD